MLDRFKMKMFKIILIICLFPPMTFATEMAGITFDETAGFAGA